VETSADEAVITQKHDETFLRRRMRLPRRGCLATIDQGLAQRCATSSLCSELDSTD
jgi:hypothetical protein